MASDTYLLWKGSGNVEITELDMKYIQSLITRDLRWWRSRSANRKGEGADANRAKIESRQKLATKLESLRRNKR